MASTSTPADDSTLPQQIPAGLELIFDMEKANIKKPVDAFEIAFHWAIIRSGLRVKNEDGTTTEKLPQGWNLSETRLYNYMNPLTPNTIYKVKIMEHIPNKSIVVSINLYEGDEPVRNSQGPIFALTSIELDDYISKNYESVETAFINPRNMEEKIWHSIMEPVGLHVLGKPPVLGPYDDKTKTREELRQEAEERRRNNPQPEPEPYYYPQRPLPTGPPGGFGPLHVPPAGGFGGLGRSDLDPLGRFGDGNTADPRGFRRPQIGPQGLPPGTVPPGARFDPFGPILPNRPMPGAPQGSRGRGGPNWAVPDPDHERPPPGWDDMFM